MIVLHVDRLYPSIVSTSSFVLIFIGARIAGLTHEEVLAQSILFIIAGYDTTASTLSFLGYLLAVNTDCQEKLIAEIDSVMTGQVRQK